MEKVRRQEIQKEDIFEFLKNQKRVSIASGLRANNLSRVLYLKNKNGEENNNKIVKGVVFELLTKDFLNIFYNATLIGKKTGRQGFDGVAVIEEEVVVIECKYKHQKLSSGFIKDAMSSISDNTNEQWSEANLINETYGINMINIEGVKSFNTKIRGEISELMMDYDFSKVKNILISCGSVEDNDIAISQIDEMGKDIKYLFIETDISEEVIDEIRKISTI